MQGREERCKNPWNGKCENTEIELYIMYKVGRFQSVGAAGQS